MTSTLSETEVCEVRDKVARTIEEISKRLVGQVHVAERLVMGLLCRGHVLLEGLPGLAKTTALKALADASGLSYSRVQFTPDLLPADVIGTQIYDPKQASFKVRKGPVFTNLLIADEINRAPAKVQSALLEAMQERQVTLGDETYPLDEPFLVMATQNPIEQEGTYPLPEAQVDRFMFKVKVGYGSFEDEMEVVHRMSKHREIPLEKTLGRDDILRFRDLVDGVHVDEKIRVYVVRLVFASREPSAFGVKGLDGMIDVGASPRASINLERAARVRALIQGRSYVTPQDVKDVSHDILHHRILPSYEAEAQGLDTWAMVSQILSSVEVP